MTGNTKKVAEVIAAQLGVKAEDVKAKKDLSKGSFVFLSSGCYGGKPGEEMREFITGNDFKGKHVALLGTSGMGDGDEVNVMEELLKTKGLLIKGSFCCKGQSRSSSAGHPSDEELTNTREFANKMKSFKGITSEGTR